MMNASSNPEDLQLDPDTDTLAMQMEGSNPGAYFLDNVSTLDGMQPPTRSVTGAATMLTSTQGLFMDFDR